MKVGIDSYCFHRFFGEVYPQQQVPEQRQTLEDFIEIAKGLAVDGVSLESCFFPSMEASYLAEICAMLDDDATHRCVTCERTVLARLDAGCQLPVGAFAEVRGSDLHMQAIVISPDGRECLRAQAAGARSNPEELGHEVAEDLLSRGAKSILTVRSE